MNWIIYFFGSGSAFFSGVGLVLAAAIFLSIYRRIWSTRAAMLLAFIGLLLIILSATPLPYWFYVVGCLISLLWLLVERSAIPRFQKWRKFLRFSAIAAWLTGAIFEIPYTFVPTLSNSGSPRLYIFADSVTAGMGNATVTWPTSLARSKSIAVKDYSQMGAKVSTMVRKVEELSLGDGVVLLEIGGNDVLGSTPASEYELELDKLLAMLTGPNRTIVMFELPLPPFFNEFGRIQRRLAQKYQVQLIPKRIFIRVLTEDGATLDSVHLTRRGHEIMEETVWEILRPAFVLSAIHRLQ